MVGIVLRMMESIWRRKVMYEAGLANYYVEYEGV